MPEISIFNPAALATPLGPYSHIARVKAAEFLFIAGQVAVDAAGNLVGGDDFEGAMRPDFRQPRRSACRGRRGWGQVVQFTTYLVHSQDVGKFMAYRGREFPRLSQTAPTRPTRC